MVVTHGTIAKTVQNGLRRTIKNNTPSQHQENSVMNVKAKRILGIAQNKLTVV